ncbi:hypothetical protein [Mycoplasma sp. VS1572C]
MTYFEIEKLIRETLNQSDIKYEILDHCENSKIEKLDNKQIPFCNLIIQIHSPINRILFIDMNYEDNYIFKVNPNNKTIPKVNKQTNKSTRKNRDWKEYIPHYLSQFENALFIKIVNQFIYVDKQDKSWMQYMKLLNFKELKDGKFINMIK